MSAFAEVLKASPEYKTLEKAVKSKNLPVGVLGNPQGSYYKFALR